MALGGISPNVSVDLNSLLGSSAFQITQSQATPIEQVQPDQLSELQDQTDSVTISSQALELSNKSESQKSNKSK